MNETSIEKMIEHLRDEYRLKVNCDYAYIHKYNGFHFLCDGAWLSIMIDACRRFEIPVRAILCTETREWAVKK